MTTGADQYRRLPWLPAALFVLVWSSGYIGGPAAVHAVAPFTALGWRFALAAVLAGVLALVQRRSWRVHRRTAVRLALVGMAMNALQFGLMYLAFDLGLPATLGALFHSLSPVVTVLLAALLLGERVNRVQLAGLAVGVGGVLLVLGPDVHAAGGPVAVLLGSLSMLSLCLGTLGQRWIGEVVDPLVSATIQFAVSAPPMLLLGLLVDGPWPVSDPVTAVVSVLWIAVVNSILGLFLLAWLVHRGGAGAAGSLFFLSPPVTAVMAWLVLGETLGARELVGLVVAVIGVGAATHTGVLRTHGSRR